MLFTENQQQKNLGEPRDAMKNQLKVELIPTSPTTKVKLMGLYNWWWNFGYAQFPGGSSATDGVVIDSRYFGTTGTATAPFNKGRTATRSGHWMNFKTYLGRCYLRKRFSKRHLPQCS